MSNLEHMLRTGRQLDVHRLVPGGHYTLAGCVSLCRPCHGPEPRRKRGDIDAVTPWRVRVGDREIAKRVYDVCKGLGVDGPSFIRMMLRETIHIYESRVKAIRDATRRANEKPPATGGVGTCGGR